MNRERILKGNTRQYISIADIDLLEQIGELLSHYTTFNKLANDALRIGIPILLEEKDHRRKKLNGGAGFAVSYPEQKKRQKIKIQPRP